jgi:multidrug efflux pump subunit AcrB
MTLAELCVRRGVFAVMLVAFLVVLGIFSFRELGVDLFPKADPATVSIEVSLPGATPEEVTTQVILPLEEALSAISGLDELTSTAMEGTARIRCQFVLEREIESAAQDVREKVAGALRDLPPNVLPPVIEKADPDSDPVLSLVVAGDRSLRETTEIADKRVRRVLETVDGVGGVDLTGARLRQIRVFVDADKLAAYRLSVIDVQHAIQNENVEVPGGVIVRGEGELGVRTLGRLDAVSQFGDVIVSNVGGTPVRVSDLGRVEDSFAEPRSWNVLDGKQAVTLEVRRQSGTNTVRIIDAIKRKIREIEKTLPAGTTLRVIRDQSVFINASIASLEEHLLFGSLLASLVVFLFIRNVRSVVIASLAIPTSIVATFTLLKVMDFTLNNMTLLALTLAVGIVIDDAIVVLENIVRYIEEKGYEPRAAAVEATKEITLAVLATTLSLVIIFLPIAFMSGYARRYVNEFGWTMAFAVLVSMLVSFTLTPLLSSRLLRRASEADLGPATKEWPAFVWIDRKYGLVLRWALDHRGAVMGGTLVTFLMVFPLNALVGRDWIPPDDEGELTALLNLPEGTSLDATSRVTSEIAGKSFFPIRALILGPDFNQVATLAKGAVAHLRKVPGLLDMDTSMSINSPELDVSIDRQRASDLGVRAADVGNAVRLMIAGEDQISTYKEGDEQYDVTLQLLPEQQKNPDVLARLMIPSSKVGQVRLDSVARIERGLGPARIDRYNRQFQVGIWGNNAPDFPLGAAAQAVTDEVQRNGLPPGYNFRFSGAVKILDETTRNLIIAFLLASIFMYMVLAAQFDSFLHPFTIMLSLPLSIPFALVSLWVTGRTLNLWSALGVLLLLGIVKKNGILQVDYTNKLRAEGVPLREAILQANHVRLRPILMTTLSIVAGLIPTAIGLGAGAAQRSAVAVTIIGGQMLCLLPTLLVTPVAYSLFAEAGERGLRAGVLAQLARLYGAAARSLRS